MVPIVPPISVRVNVKQFAFGLYTTIARLPPAAQVKLRILPACLAIRQSTSSELRIAR
jgi:hypothetical protein